ncbi:molybdenum cofactor guanylyltransferase [Sphingomonas sp. Leaf21]|jgi:molybdopterin-guanine dinucleotide biosynthesis protein A|uniref:molybdenum cofactor guanylyltransferase n=1 Tax=Sphingomonas sp. Leaf21 TaxID=2876550 RepID=UPI001E4A00A1|nr:molybdenum cofactor guanylyltransferase [Sphingomonas sp. Leaf21]
MSILGAVLAGGRSSRFGSNKAFAMLGDQPLVTHARGLIAPYCTRVVQVGGDDGVPDMPEPGLGPLGGIAGALDYAAANGFRCVLTIGCDMPRLPEGLIEAIMRREPSYCQDAPVLGLWPAALGAHLMAHLSLGHDRSMRGWARAVGAIPIASPEPIANVNTPADLAEL